MKNNLVIITLFLLIILLFGCIQTIPKETESDYNLITAEELSEKLDMPLSESTNEVNNIEISDNTFKAELNAEKTFPALTNAFNQIGLSIQSTKPLSFEGGLENTEGEYSSGYALGDINVVSEFKKTTTPVIYLNKIRPQDSIKHAIKIKNEKQTDEEVILNLEYEISNAKTIVWDGQEYELIQGEILEFTAFEKEIEYSEGFATTYSVPIAEIEANLENGGKSILDFSDIMFEKHRAMISYDGQNALITLQVNALIKSNTEYVIDPYLSYLPPSTEPTSIQITDKPEFMQILDFNKDGKNDLVLAYNNKLNIFYDYLNSTFENPDKTITFEEDSQILNLEGYENEIAVGVFPYAVYFIDLDNIEQEISYVNQQNQLPKFDDLGVNFYYGDIEQDLYFASVPNYDQKGAVLYISKDSTFENSVILYSDLIGSKTTNVQITCTDEICCFGVSYESKGYCVNIKDFNFDNKFIKYSDIAFLTIEGENNLGKEILLNNEELVITSQNKVHYLTNIFNQNTIDVSNYPTTYEKVGFGNQLFEYDGMILASSTSGLYILNSMDQGNIADTNSKYELTDFSKFSISDNGNYAVLTTEGELIVGASLPDPLFSMMDISSIDACPSISITDSGDYLLTSDLIINNDICLNFVGSSSTTFTLDCQGHTITAIGDNAEAIRVNTASILDIRNCNFIVENSNSAGINTTDVREFTSENCNFNVSNGENSYGIKSNISDILLNGKITFSDLDILMNQTENSNAIQLENMRNSISITEINIQLDSVIDTAGIAIKDSRPVSLTSCDINTIGSSSQKIVGYSLDKINTLNMNNVNANLIGKGVTGVAVYNDAQQILLENSNYNIEGKGITGIYLNNSLITLEIKNVNSIVEESTYLTDDPTSQSLNLYVNQSLPHSTGLSSKYSWLYSLFSDNGVQLAGIRDNEFTAKASPPLGGISSLSGILNKVSVKLDKTYEMVIENNDINSEHCISLYSDNSYGQIKNNNLVRSLDDLSVSPSISQIFPCALFTGELSQVSSRELLITNNNFTSSADGVVFGQVSSYNSFDFNDNEIINCQLHGLKYLDYNPIESFLNNYICNNGLHSYFYFDIHGTDISYFPTPDFDTTTCTEYNFVSSGLGNCINPCFDCPSIENFNITANCTDYINTGFAGTQTAPWDPSLDIPTVYSNDTICLTSNFTNPHLTDLEGYLRCYRLSDPSSPALDPMSVHANPLAFGLLNVLMDGPEYINIFAGNDATYDRSIPDTSINTCNYYQCFSYWDPQAGLPAGCVNDWEELFFFVENREPTISVAPTIIETGSGMFCDITDTLTSFDDPDGDSAGTPVRYNWYVNGELQTVTSSTLIEDYYAPGDTIICEVSIPDDSDCPQLYSNTLSNSTFIQAEGWVAVDPHPEGYTDSIYYCDFEYQMPSASNYQINVTWYAFDNWIGDWSTSTRNEPFMVYTNSYTDLSTTADDDLRTSLDFEIEKCHYLACEVNITAIDGSNPGYSLEGNSTMSDTEFPISGQGEPTKIINRPPYLTGEPELTITPLFESSVSINCGISDIITFSDDDYNDRDSGRREYTWYLDGVVISGEENMALITELPSDGGTYTCCVDMFDLIVNGNCQDSAQVCGDIEIPPRTLSFDVNLSADPITDYLAPPGLRTSPVYEDDCEPIKYEDTRVDNCAYENSNFTCTIDNIVYTGVGAGPTKKDIVIYTVRGDILYEETGISYDEIIYYNNIPDTGCLENSDCQKGDILYCNVTLYDVYGELETFTSNPVQIHNFIPEISKPEVYVITDAFPDDTVIGDYTGEYLKDNYENQFLCIPSDEWQQGHVLPDYNNDTWENISYYWEWSAVDTGYINTTTGCDYDNIYGQRCSGDECFETAVKNYLCSLQTARESASACEDLENISCWGPDLDNDSHWLPFVPMAQLRNLPGFDFIANTNVTYGVCDWASLGGLTGCPPAGEFEIECINGEWVGVDDCRQELYNNEMEILQQCAQGTAQCYELLESCSFSNSYTPPGIVSPTESCPPDHLITIAGFDLAPPDINWSDPWSSGTITNWPYECSGSSCTTYGGTYGFWHTSWYLREPYVFFGITPYMTEACDCDSNDYFGVKQNPDLPSFSMWNTYLSDIHGLFYEGDKAHGIPIRCCINQSDEEFETTYSDMVCSDPTCGNYLDCGACYYDDETSDLICYSKSNCVSGDEEQCFMYLQDSCNEEILWNTDVESCSGVDTGIRCYYNYTHGTAFDVERHVNLATGDITIEQTDNVQQCYPCMQYWPMLGDDDFYATDFNEEWGYYYNPWWLRDLLFNESYVPNSTEDPEEYPIPNKVSLFDDTISYENITIDTSSNIVEPCNPNTDTMCEISLREWWSGPYGAQQNNTFNADSYDSAWAEEYGTKLKTDLADEFDISEENIVGRFFATTFKYCNQWDEEFIKDIFDYSDKENIDLRFGNEWPNVSLGILSVDNSEYPFAGRDGNANYLTSGIFSHENGIGSSQYLVWNAHWPTEYAQYNELECDNYEQCRKHSRISADYVFGIVYNTTYKHITCECPEGLTEGDCTIEFGDANSVGRPGDRVWEFNRNTCSCVPVCAPRPDAPNCTLIEPGTVAHYDDHLCEWTCRTPVTPRLIVPGTSGGSGYGTGIHWSGIDSESGEMIEEESIYALLAEDDYYPEARFGPPGSDGFPTCGINEIQTEDSNCFVSDEYYNKLYDYSLSHDISDLIIGTSSEDISLDCSDLEDYSDYSNARSFCHYSYSLWDLDSCQTHDEERIGFMFDNNYQNETENEGCGFCQGLLINNTAPSIDYLGIVANDDPSVDPPTNFTCTIDGFNDIDTNPADLIKNATFRWCPYEHCELGDEYASEIVLGENANSTYVNSALPIDPITGDPIIYCCAQVYDTDWQSKQSEEYCQAFSAEASEECNISLDGLASTYIFDSSSIEEFEVDDNYTFTSGELPYKIADLHLIHEGINIGNYPCYQTPDGINCDTYSENPEIVIGELDLGNYEIIANNSDKGCYPDSENFRIVSGIPITNCSVLNTPNAHYYVANNITVNGDMGDDVCTPVLTSTTPNLDRFVPNYPDCLHCCLIVNASNITIDFNGYSIVSNVDYNTSSLDRLGGICAKDKTDVEIYNSNTTDGGLFSWDRGITFLKSNNTNINNIEIDSLALAGPSRANEHYMSGISLSGCQNTTVADSRIARYTSGTEVFYSKETDIKNNIFETTSFGVSTSWLGEGIGPSTSYRIPIGGTYCDYIISDLYIENNTFLDCGTGIKGLKTGNLFAFNNNFTNSRYVGVELRGCGITNIIYNNTFDTIIDPSGSAIRTTYLNFGDVFVFENNEIVNSPNGILIQKSSNLRTEINSNQITDCGTGLQLSESNNVDLQINDNTIEDNDKGVLLDYSADTFAFDLIPNMDTTGWPEGTARIQLCDSDPLIGCYDHFIPVSSDCSNKTSLYTSKECYNSSEIIAINMQRVCRGKTNSSGIVDYPSSIISLKIIDSSGVITPYSTFIPYGAGHAYQFSRSPLSENDYIVNGTVTCYYEDESLNQIYNIVTETFEVSSTCPDNYYHFANDNFNSNPSYCWPIDETITENWITYHTVSSGIVEFMPTLEIYDSSGALELASDGTGTCFESNEITLDNNEICDNTIYDINDTLIYCSVPSITETTYTSNTCDEATSYSVDDNLICADICGTVPEDPDTCNCDVNITSITWPAHDEPLPEAVCGGENVTIKVDFTDTDNCSGLDEEEISISISNSGMLSSIISSGNASSTGYYTYQFDRSNTNFGDYRVTATHSKCSKTTGEFPFGQCYGEDTCQILNAPCNDTLLCCDPDNTSSPGYDFYLTCVGFCCVPEGGTCYPDIEDLVGRQCCPGSICIGGTCKNDGNITTNTTTNTTDNNESLLNLTDLFNYPNCSFDECNRTSDCCAGYCYRNMCMGAPATMWLFGFAPRPGCEGLPIEPIGILGFIICDLMWLWVLVTALIAAYKARQSYRMPIPIFAFIFPFIVALFLYPYLGVIVGLFEILIFYRKQEKEELEYEEKKARGEFTNESFGYNSNIE